MAGVMARAFGMDPIDVLDEHNAYRRLIRGAAFWGSVRLHRRWDHERGEF